MIDDRKEVIRAMRRRHEILRQMANEVGFGSTNLKSYTIQNMIAERLSEAMALAFYFIETESKDDER